MIANTIEVLRKIWSGGTGRIGLALDAADRRQLDNQRDGRFSQFTKTVVPVGLGDYFGPFRVVATRPVMFDSLRVGDARFEVVVGGAYDSLDVDGVIGYNLLRLSSFTLDYQLLTNPAYNADRGPVNFAGVRFHAEY